MKPKLIEKLIKILLVLFMILGIIFAISNFSSSNIQAGGKGTWVLEPDGTWICKGDGPGCDEPVK